MTFYSPANLKGINYCPNTYFHTMWQGQNYGTAGAGGTVQNAISADLAELVSLGFNTVRVPLQVTAYNAPDSTGSFNANPVTSAQLARLTDFVGRCNTAGIKMEVCLFDLFGNHLQITNCTEWLASIMTALTPLSAIACLEIKNEISFNSTAVYSGQVAAGFTGLLGATPGTGLVLFADSGTTGTTLTFEATPNGVVSIPANTEFSIVNGSSFVNLVAASAFSSSSTTTSTLTTTAAPSTDMPAGSQVVSLGQAMTTFAMEMMTWLRANTTGIPITYSVNNPTQLASGLQNMAGQYAPDWVEYHSYPGGSVGPDGEIGNMDSLYSSINEAWQACQAVGQLMRIGEFGLGVTPGGSKTQAMLNYSQANWIRAARFACRQLGVTCPEPQPWAMYDNAESHGNAFGLWDVNGNRREAVSVYEVNPPGQPVTPPKMNLSFVGPVVDPSGNTLPQGWSLYKGNTGTQEVTSSCNGGVWTLTSTGYSTTDNPPAAYSDTIDCTLVPGETVLTLSVEATGTAQNVGVQLNWWNGTSYVSKATGTTVNLTSTPQTLTVSATIPANCTYAVPSINFSPESLNTAGGTIVLQSSTTNRTGSVGGNHYRLVL